VSSEIQKLQRTAKSGLPGAPDRLTVEAYLDECLTTRVPGTVAPRTLELYERAVSSYLVPSIGRIRLAKLSPADVATMLRHMDSKGYSPSTQRMARATLRRALRIAEQDGLLSRNVAAIAEGPKLERREGAR
jgi:integrase